MTISEQTDYALKHPAFRNALKNYENGHTDDLRYILIILQKEAANKTKESQIRCYRQWKRLNIADIIDMLEKNEIPSTFDVKLPVVKLAEPVIKKTIKLKPVVENQYQLEFIQVA